MVVKSKHRIHGNKLKKKSDKKIHPTPSNKKTNKENSGIASPEDLLDEITSKWSG